MCSITATIVRMPSGMRAWVMPMSTPVRLKITATGAFVSPVASSSLLSAPLRPRSTIQANARPERQEHPERQPAPPPRIAGGQEIRDRIAAEQGERGRPRGDLERDEEHVDVEGRGEEAREVLAGESAAAVDDAQPQELPHRIDEEQGQECECGEQGPALPPHRSVVAVSGSRLPASRGQGRPTRAPGVATVLASPVSVEATIVCPLGSPT